MSRQRQSHMPDRVMSKLGILASWPGFFPFVLSRQLCFSTAVLSNVGDPTRRFQSRFPRDAGRLVAGNLCLTRMQGVTPLRPGTRASFFVNSYANELTISARFDPLLFHPAETGMFLDQMTKVLASPQENPYVTRAA